MRAPIVLNIYNMVRGHAHFSSFTFYLLHSSGCSRAVTSFLFLSLLSTNYTDFYLFVMPKRARSPEEQDQPSGLYVDLLEFIQPAFWAMLFFMFLTRGFDQPGLIVSVLNGQGRLTCVNGPLHSHGSYESKCFAKFNKYFI